jgi:hypothetical protein
MEVSMSVDNIPKNIPKKAEFQDTKPVILYN